MLLRIVTLYVMVATSAAFRSLQSKIPNGDIVPNPCQGGWWPGVGHEDPLGGGARNPFGRDFEAAGKNWTEEFCYTDSDGDGRWNGLELGDPDCVWREGEEPHRSSGITHPGVCEDTDCGRRGEKNSWMEGGCSSTGVTNTLSTTILLSTIALYLFHSSHQP